MRSDQTALLRLSRTDGMEGLQHRALVTGDTAYQPYIILT